MKALFYRAKGGFILEIDQETIFIPVEDAIGIAEFISKTDLMAMEAPIRHQGIEITDAGKAALAVAEANKKGLPQR